VFLISQREGIVALAARYRIPAIYNSREWVATGPDDLRCQQYDAYRLVGIYTGPILKGEKPADLPVILPTKFKLVST